VSLTSLQVARAAYVWQLQRERHAVGDRLADLHVAFQWLLQLQVGEASTDLLRARTAYVAELHAARLERDAEIADLAAVHQDLISAELVYAAAVSMPPRRRGCTAPRPRPPVAT